MTRTCHAGGVSLRVDGQRTWGTVHQVLAGRLLVIDLDDGRRIRRGDL